MGFVTSFAANNVAEAAGAATGAGIGIVFLMFWLVIVLALLAAGVFWWIALIHALTHNDVKDRVMWIVLLFVVGSPIGVAYYFAVQRPYNRGGMRAPTVS